MKDAVYRVLYEVVDAINADLPAGAQLGKQPDASIYGEYGVLDSLGLVTFVVAAEEKVSQAFGRLVTLADDRALSQQESPFRTMSTLADYICGLLQEPECA